MKNCIKYLLIAPVLMVGGSSAGMAMDGGDLNLLQLRTDEDISNAIKELMAKPPVLDAQTVADIETMETKINEILAECDPKDPLSDAKINEIVKYACGDGPEVVALRNQNNTHVSIVWERLMSKEVTEDDGLKILERIGN
jgi:hypothetical protein